MKIALTGNPNSGKTTLFNAITGRIEKVGNWAGVTVDRKEGKIKSNYLNGKSEIVAVDLPGAYSMSAFTSEEHITQSFIKTENPDVIVNIVDATNLSRSLFFTTQLLDLGIPVVVALNKSDLNKKKSIDIDMAALSNVLGCPVVNTVSTSSSKDNGLNELIEKAISVVGSKQSAPFSSSDVNLSNKDEVVANDTKRYEFVKGIIEKVEKRKDSSHKVSASDKADKILAHKWFGIPIFALAMFIVFSVSQAWVGPFIADALVAGIEIGGAEENEEEELADFEEEDMLVTSVEEDELTDSEDEELLAANGEEILDTEDESLLALEDAEEEEEEEGRVIGGIEPFMEWLAEKLEDAGVSDFLVAFLVEGIIGGFAAVIGFLPLIMVMFFLIALLEDCGYMARVAVVMDRFLRAVGLSGKSIIPMVVGTACGIPGVMATRTIRNERQRRTTAMLTPFMPCGAKLPVIALFAGVFFEDAAWVSFSMYFFAIILMIVLAFCIQRITGEKNARSFFIIELPEYSVPSLKRATISMLSRAKAFIIKAGTIILVCNALVFLMQEFNFSLQPVEEADESILAAISTPFAFLLIPLGFATWQLAAAAITGFIAKENVVGTLAVVFGISNFIDVEEFEIVAEAGAASGIYGAMGITAVAALSYLVFNLFTPPCFAAIGAMNSEMENKKWLWAGIGLQFAVGYVAAFFVYQIGSIVTGAGIGSGFVPGLIFSGALIALLVYLMKKGDQKAEAKAKNAG